MVHGAVFWEDGIVYYFGIDFDLILEELDS